MAELSKYDIIFEELSVLEKQVANLVSRNKELTKENVELVKQNSALQARVRELEDKESVLISEVEDLKRGGLTNLKDRDSLKLKLNELVNKIDFHLRS